MEERIIPLAVPGAQLLVAEDCLMISFEEEHLALSTAIYGGGLHKVKEIFNQKLTHFYGKESDFPGGSVKAYLKTCAEARGADTDRCAVLLTAADVYLYSHKVFRSGNLIVEIISTGGVEKTACRASSAPLYREADGHFEPVGTINMMALIHGSLPDGIMARALITLTEGKTAALQDLGIADVNNGKPATGTGTDGITLVTEIDGAPYTDAGPFSELGAFLAKAAYESVTECLVAFDHPWNQFEELKTPCAVELRKRLRDKG